MGCGVQEVRRSVWNPRSPEGSVCHSAINSGADDYIRLDSNMIGEHNAALCVDSRQREQDNIPARENSVFRSYIISRVHHRSTI